MTRLALFHPSFAMSGGAEFLIASQALGLQKAGYEVRLVTMAFDQGRWGARLKGIPVSLFPKRRGWLDVVKFWDRAGRILRRAAIASPYLLEQDVVLAYNFPCSAMLGSMEIPARKVWQCNEPPRNVYMREANPVLSARVEASGGLRQEDATASFARQLSSFDARVAKGGYPVRRRTLDQESVARLDVVYAISEFSRSNARRIYGRCAETVVYPIVRFPEGGWARQGLDRSGLKVMVHSRLEVLKNIDTVIRGFSRFRERVDPHAVLHVVGEGEHRSRLAALARELMGDTGCIFHGFLPDAELRAVYDACDVFALLPLDEPFGMVFPEAAAKGLLLVGPDHGGPLEILEGGNLGWICNPFDPETLAEALAEIWALDDGEVQRRRERADASCRSRFSAAVILPKLRSVLDGNAL